MPNINWFSKVVADEAGRLSFVPGHSAAGGVVELRLEMDTLVVLNTCQHPLDPRAEYRANEILLEVFEGPAAEADDASLTVRPENLRAWENSQTYHLLKQP